MVCVRVVNGGEGVPFDRIFLQVGQTSHNKFERWASLFIDSVEVMHFSRSIYAQAYEEIIFFEEYRPVIVNECSIGLNSVKNFHSRYAVFFLKFYRASEKAEAHQGWFAALPRHGDFRDSMCFD